MLNALPFVGWLLDFLKVRLAAPFWFIWTVNGIGEQYFGFLPPVYLHPGFWNVVGVFIVVPILYGIFVPKLASVNQSVGEKK